MMLRSYRSEKRAEAYARVLRARFPEREFKVVLSPFYAYAFRWLIRVGKGAYVGGK